jgi:glycosyltransferase involved in cell wall biosynthesis
MAVPDRYVTWLPFGTFCGLSVARRLRPSAILSTSPYPTAHLIATIIQARTRLPWLADFRDPWIEEGFHPRPGSLRYRIESALERLVLTRADHITVTTPQLRRDLLRRYPYIPPAKISVIYNGFDDDDFADLPAQATPEHFEILHAGLVTPAYRDPGPLLRAIATLIAQGTLSPDHARVVFLGGGQWLCSREFASVLEELRLQSIVQVLPPIPYHAVPERLSRAAVLLLLQASDDTRSLIPAKLFEYLRVGRPVLALCPEGATSDLLHELEFGVVCDPASEDRLRQAVVTLYRSWLRGEPVARPRNLDRFSRRALTAELAALLHELTHRS